MPTPLSVGTTTFREISVQETLSKSGFDTLAVILRGASSNLAAEKANWTRGITYPGYPTMFLDTRDSVDRGPVSEINLTFHGFLNSFAAENGLVDATDDISRQSVTLSTDAGDNVSFSFYAQVTTVRWMYRGTDIPTQPRFPSQVPSVIPTNLLFQPNPPNYAGSVAGQYKARGRLSQFQRTRMAPGVWGVVESWETLIEPINEIT